MVKENNFREDLLYRINTIQIDLPPLRERTEDIQDLSDYFLKIYATKYNKPNLKMSNIVYEKLLNYSWPGNIRELKHTIERAVILCESDNIKADDFLFKQSLIDDHSPSSLKLSDVEKWTIETVIKKCRGNLSKAAEILDVSRTTLYSKIEKYRIHI